MSVLSCVTTRGLRRLGSMSYLLGRSGRRTVFSLSGVYPTVVTPFSGREEAVDLGRFENLLRHLDRFPVAGFALLASSGESTALGYERKLEIVKHARDFLGKHRIIIAGAGLESTADTIELTKKMAECGADAALVYNPSYFRERLDSAAYVEHFSKIADESPIPIVLYNIPTHTDLDIPIDVVCDLASHQKIAGLLDTGGNITRIATICMKTAKYACKRTNPFNVVAGSGGFFLPALSVGVSGAICNLANVLPFELCLLQELFEQGKLVEAQQLQWRMLLPNEAVSTKYGVAGLKAVLRVFLGIDSGSVRAPLKNLSASEVDAITAIFRDSGFFNGGPLK